MEDIADKFKKIMYMPIKSYMSDIKRADSFFGEKVASYYWRRKENLFSNILWKKNRYERLLHRDRSW